MNTKIFAAIDINVFQAKKAVLRTAIGAKQALGIEVTEDKRRLEAMRYNGPTLIASVELVGWERRPVYDEYPSLATFDVRIACHRDIELQSLEAAKRLMDARHLMNIWHDDFPWERDGCTKDLVEAIQDLDTNVDGVRLRDNLGNVVAEATVTMGARMPDGTGWTFCPSVTWKDVDVTALEHREALLAKAASLDAEAQVESGWDNFGTARDMWAEAESIRRTIQIAENVTRLVA